MKNLITLILVYHLYHQFLPISSPVVYRSPGVLLVSITWFLNEKHVVSTLLSKKVKQVNVLALHLYDTCDGYS